MTPEDFAARFDVPRGTISRLARYADLLAEWQRTMNLVSPASLPMVWERHFADSAQLARLTPPGLHWLDVGAGAGFPGLVIAAMEHGRVTLVESVAKKCRFLEAVVAELGLDATVVRGRAETVPPAGADVVTARAVAPLATLFGWTAQHGHARTQWLFPKGRRWEEELADARQAWDFQCESVPSITDHEARILVATGVRNRR
ncbi:MAG: 16S rRNA (guanine(527)-N(7))-methyltransferase RsmG [Thermaurantiacus sp.]